jgi:pyridoxamine 5'-phosphate oxidase
MSATAGASTKSPGPAPWKAAFLEHVMKNMDSPEFVLSTLHPAPEGSKVPWIPHARFCIFRGMFAELPENKHYDGPKNEHIFESEMPTFTTDIRMEKAVEIMRSSPGGKPGQLEHKEEFGSGGGGPVEAVWWVKEKNIQWRIKGECYLVGPDMEGEENSGVRTTKSELGKRLHIVEHGKEGDWSWATEVTNHFGNLSPGMRGKLPSSDGRS